jgi:hypothetical protein
MKGRVHPIDLILTKILPMKTTQMICFSILMGSMLAARCDEPANPSIQYDAFAMMTVALEPVRHSHRISEDAFIRMAKEPGTVVLDARSRDRFERIHIEGATHLALTDFTEEALLEKIPDKNTRILIYCNNNFENEPVNFARKTAAVALNIQTYINLQAYGYTNVYELGPMLDVLTTKIRFVGTDVSVNGVPMAAVTPATRNGALPD